MSNSELVVPTGVDYSETRQHEVRIARMVMIDGNLTSNTVTDQSGTSARVFNKRYWGFASVSAMDRSSADKIARKAADLMIPVYAAKDDLISSIKKAHSLPGCPWAHQVFSGVIKNSFKIENGELGQALSESMISANMAEMLKGINGISKEHLDLGGEDFPWIRMPNLHFS